MTNIIYSNYLKSVLSGTIDLVTDNIYAALISGTYTPDTGHVHYSDISGHEAVDGLSSYEKGGILLTSKTVTISAAGEAIFDAADIAWNTATLTASGVAIWKSGASETEHHLISWTELGNTSSVNGTFQITWSPTNGIFKAGSA